MPANNRGIVVFSGGSAANNLVDVFEAVRVSKDCSLSYIIPISDNGGSTSEIIRVFGGPSIGACILPSRATHRRARASYADCVIPL